MRLEADFIITGTLIILLLVPLYIYRKKVFKFLYRKGDFKSFFNDVKNYLNSEYPNIPFDYTLNSRIKEEKDIKIKQTLLVEYLVSQFTEYEYTIQTQNSINKELLWSTYDQNCKPLKDKLPSDWPKRKEFTFKRDKEQCKRCGHKVKLYDAYISFIKPISEGGGYNFENLITLCVDCNKIINKTSSKNSLIEEHLMKKVTKH
ncbi:HNH endonuclease signature motif containing protein [Malaciobacter mytili]|uniref:HNH endonuclease n=1 Tax=Malaciobacter mytili TaxID=603050 RepID=UPI003BAF06EF